MTISRCTFAWTVANDMLLVLRMTRAAEIAVAAACFYVIYAFHYWTALKIMARYFALIAVPGLMLDFHLLADAMTKYVQFGQKCARCYRTIGCRTWKRIADS